MAKKDDTEALFLACACQWPENVDTSFVRPDDFEQDDHKRLFTALCKMKEEGSPVTMLSLAQESSQPLVLSLYERPVSQQDYARLEAYLKEASNRRKAKAAGESLIRLAEHAPIDEAIEAHVQTLKGLSAKKAKGQGLDEEIFQYQEWLEERSKPGSSWSWGPSFQWLDQHTDGIQKKKTYRIGANSNVGKTQFVYNVILALLAQGARVTFYTLENEKPTTLNYLLSNMMGVNSRELAKGRHAPQWDLLDPITPLLTIVDDLTEIGQIMQHCEKHTPDVVFLDYIGLCRVKGATTDSKYAEYAERIPPFVKRLGISWVDLSNLPKNSDDELIKLHGEFFGSSLLKNNLDVGIHFTYNKKFYEWKNEQGKALPASMHTKQVLDLRLTKNRLGPVGLETTYVLDFDKGGRWRQATPEEETRWSF